jgi:hypothetical protein
MLFSSARRPSCVPSYATSQGISSGQGVAAPGRVDTRTPGENSFLRGRWVLAIVILCLGALDGIAPSAGAQTAHFSGAVTTLRGGFYPTAVAVEGSGNVFVADHRSR